jgi:beta-barrel assembly-enhancing protease
MLHARCLFDQIAKSYTVSCNGMTYRIALSDIKKITLDKPVTQKALWQSIKIGSDVDISLLSRGYQYDMRAELKEESLEMIQNCQKYQMLFYDEYIEDYLQGLLYKIHAITLNDGRPGNLSVMILKDNQPNAFCLPNGTILISTGLLSTIRSEDELIGILAHEVAHFVLDHQIININKTIERQKRADFWAAFGTAIAAASEVYLSSTTDYDTFGTITLSTAVFSNAIGQLVVERLGNKYNKEQEWEADNAAALILEHFNRDPKAFSAALTRIKNYYILNGNFLALSGSGTHPDLDERITRIGTIDLSTITDIKYDRKVSFINTYNALNEYYNYKQLTNSLDLSNRNIAAGVGSEEDYIIKAMIIRQLFNTPESNLEALELLQKAKSINNEPVNYLFKQEAITLIRLDRTKEAIEALKIYLSRMEAIPYKTEHLENEINWTKKMLSKDRFWNP